MADESKKRNLGRGLSALLGEDVDAAVAAAASHSQRTVPIEQLSPGRYQPRRFFDDTEIAELADSIRSLGILQPILVRAKGGGEGDYEIIAGERRWRAAQKAQLHEVPIIERALSDEEALEIALVENLQRENLSPLDEAEGYRRLIDEFAHTQENLAKVLGKSRSHVANMLRLLNLPDAVKKYLANGELTAGHARALLSAPDPASMALKVVRRGLNVRQTEKLVKPKTGKRSQKSRPLSKDVDTLALERDLAALLGLKVDIKFLGKGGSLTVHYDSLEQLDDILHRLSKGEHGRPVQGSNAAEEDEGTDLGTNLIDDVDAVIAQLDEGASIVEDDEETLGRPISPGFSLSDEEIDSLLSDRDDDEQDT